MVTRGALLQALDLDAIEAAIARVETQTTGELCVSLAPLFWGDVRHAAERAFSRLRVGSTRDRNGVLIFVAPARRRFVILGDAGIDAQVGPALWDQTSRALAAAFHEGRYTSGLTEAIEAIGAALAQHFPPDPNAAPADKPNVLPNAVDVVE